MSIKIVDTFEDLHKCFLEGNFSKDLWNQYIASFLPYAKKTIEKDAAEYSFEQQILPVLNSVLTKKERLVKLHQSFLDVVYGLEEKILKHLQIQVDVTIVLYLGLCNGAGWVISFSNVSHILLGIEKIIELNWYNQRDMRGLIFHELGHVLHEQNRTTAIPSLLTLKDKALWQIYTEGIAMYFEQLLCEDEQFYHQDKNGWLKWCNENRCSLFNEYIRVIEENESYQKFFGDWCSYRNVSDTGYYLGCELIRLAHKTKTTQQILDLSLNEIEEFLYKCKD